MKGEFEKRGDRGNLILWSSVLGKAEGKDDLIQSLLDILGVSLR